MRAGFPPRAWLDPSLESRWRLEPEWPEITAADRRRIELVRKHCHKYAGNHFYCGRVKVAVNPALPPHVLLLMINGAYEAGDAKLIEKYVGRGDNCAVLGAGIGVTTAAMWLASGKPVISIDADKSMEPWIAETARLNGATIRFMNGVARGPTKSRTSRFYISQEFWASSIRPGTYLKRKRVSVPNIDVDALLREHSVDTVMIDIEGAEHELFQKISIPLCVKKLFVEIHRPNLGGTKTAQTMSCGWKQGFQLVDLDGLTGFWQRR